AFVTLLDAQHARAGRPAAWPMTRLLTLKAVWLPSAVAVTALVAAVALVAVPRLAFADPEPVPDAAEEPPAATPAR
ncbi:hypothetical protein, partial [Burkholderia cenocepacia]|uniref:hypothetical protein n=1 Tax=Burkholderia cenocepacia TaxID=95486 RepID=UPI0038CC0249